MKPLWLVPMSLLCALLFGLVLYLRLNDGDPALRLALVGVSGVMAVLMVLLVGRAGGSER